MNPSAEIRFLECDLSLLHNVDLICNEIKKKEKFVNLLFLSAGFLSMKKKGSLVYVPSKPHWPANTSSNKLS